jgi:asparagine synthetase B (glutamine-hydrolysing)
VRPSGEVIIGDHIRNLLARLTPAERLPDERILTEHYLFRVVIGASTYSATVTKLKPAELLVIDLGSGTVETEVFDRIDPASEPRRRDAYVDLVDAKLAEVTGGIDDGAGLMFSGGVDSTLLMTYLRGRVDPVTFVPDTAEFGVETGYARTAANLLGVRSTELPMPEAEFVSMVETATDTAGIPCFDDATPYIARTIREAPQELMIAGQGADSAFGMSLKLARFASWFRWPVLRPAVSWASGWMPGHLGYRMRQVAPMAAGLSKAPLDPAGWAGTAMIFGDTSLFRRVADPALITDILTSQLEDVTDRLATPIDPGRTFLSHVELAQWMIVLYGPMTVERLIATGSGKRVVAPYCSAAILEALATIPLEDRYVRRLSAKWILKDLLERRLPAYPVNQRKRATALPQARFFEDGPLTGIWERYDVPEIFAGSLRDELVASSSPTAWNAFTYAVWEQRIARNPTLAGHPVAVGVSHPIAHRG